MDNLVFEKFHKIGRLNRLCTITEKIDGTNAQIAFDADGNILVGSRRREIFPEGTEGKPKGCDNAGFARWAYDNKEALFEFLGEGRHYGEWCGGKIQRGYGVGRQFLLFNVSLKTVEGIPEDLTAAGLGFVPVLFTGAFDTGTIREVMEDLRISGSYLNPDAIPEGVIIYHHAKGVYFKATFEKDAEGKWSK